MRKNLIFKTAAAVLFTAILLCGCYNPSTVMSIDGTNVACGTYLIRQLAEAENAVAKLTDEQGSAVSLQDARSMSLEGVPFDQYVREKTIESCKRYIFTEQEFSKYGITIPNGIAYYYDSYCQNLWAEYSTFYMNNGISYDTFLNNTLNGYKYTLVFSYLYTDPQSPMCIPDDELSQCFRDNYRTVSYIKLPDSNNDSSDFSADQVAEIESLADGLVDDLNAGAEMEDLFNERYSEALAIGHYTLSVQDSVVQANLSSDVLVSPLTTTEDPVLLSTVLSSPINTNGWVVGSNGVTYIYSIGDHVTSDTAWKDYSSYLAEILKADDFEAYVQSNMAAMSVQLDEKAADYYSVANIKTADR
ncbi:MAG: hypothetical protein IKE18_10420 [Oscillospiraceae bacterium]|nr:hypothetical protein [Oscillospiraceae bacterium]